MMPWYMWPILFFAAACISAWWVERTTKRRPPMTDLYRASILQQEELQAFYAAKFAPRQLRPDPTNVTALGGITRLEVDANRVIDKAAEVDFSHVVIIGFDAAGNEYFASSYADGAEVVWHIERAKFKLMVITDKIATEAPID